MWAFSRTRRRAAHLCIKRVKKSKYNLLTLPWTRVRDVTETRTGLYEQVIKRTWPTLDLLISSYSTPLAQGSQPFGARDLLVILIFKGFKSSLQLWCCSIEDTGISGFQIIQAPRIASELKPFRRYFFYQIVCLLKDGNTSTPIFIPFQMYFCQFAKSYVKYWITLANNNRKVHSFAKKNQHI